MQIAQVLAGYSLGGADLLRRAMGKKIKSEMDAQRAPVRRRRRRRAASSRRAPSMIFDQMAKFAGYGFNKSHAAAYALVAYQTAYLKANHPVEFMAALDDASIIGNTDKLNHVPPGMRPARHRAAAARHQPLRRRLHGRRRPKTGKPAIRYALAAVKGVGAQAMRELVAERDARRPRSRICSISRRRLDAKSFNRRQFEKPGQGRRLRCAQPATGRRASPPIDLLLRHASRAAERAGEPAGKPVRRRRRPADGGSPRARRCRSSTDWPPVERLQHEFDAIGFYLSSHPLDRLWPQPRARRRGALRRSAGGAGGRRQRPASSLAGIVDRQEGAHLGARQPLRLRADVRHQRRLRGHGVLRGAGARPARCSTAASR